MEIILLIYIFLKVFFSLKNTCLRNIIKIGQGQEVNSYIEIGTINRDFINSLLEYPWHVVFHLTD